MVAVGLRNVSLLGSIKHEDRDREPLEPVPEKSDLLHGDRSGCCTLRGTPHRECQLGVQSECGLRIAGGEVPGGGKVILPSGSFRLKPIFVEEE
jgi:hypothetical protein